MTGELENILKILTRKWKLSSNMHTCGIVRMVRGWVGSFVQVNLRVCDETSISGILHRLVVEIKVHIGKDSAIFIQGELSKAGVLEVRGLSGSGVSVRGVQVPRVGSSIQHVKAVAPYSRQETGIWQAWQHVGVLTEGYVLTARGGRQVLLKMWKFN